MNKRYIKIAIFLVIAIVLSITVFFSKRYFDVNYNTHETVESNLNLYRIKMQQQEEQKHEQDIQIVKEEQIEVHPQPTEVVTEKTNVKPSTKLNDDIPTSKVESQSVVSVTDKQKTTAEQKKPAKKDETLTKPKTLEEKPTVTSSVLKNPAFQTYVIQVGAFSTKEEADIMKIRVSKIQAVNKFRVESKYFPEKKLYKVLVEYFETAESAKQICAELKKENVQCFATKI